MLIFQLKSLEIRGGKNCNNGYKAGERDLGLYDSREQAEKNMLNVIKEENWNTFFAFFIYARIVNPGSGEEGFQSVTSYFPDGILYCESPYDESCKKKFRGRPPETIKLKVGDLAWEWRGDSIEPCLVFAQPLTTGEYEEMCRKNGVDPAGPDAIAFDYTDDCYGVFNFGRGQDHPAVWRLFPFNGKISKRNMDRLLESKKWWEEGCPE